MSGIAAAVSGGVGILGAVVSNNNANKQVAATNSANALQGDALKAQQANEAPYQAAGVSALGQMQDPRFQHNFSTADFTTSPGYQFSLTQGNNALNAANAAAGGPASGAALTALSNYNLGSANNEYQQAFNNYQTQTNNQYGRLATLAGYGAGANTASNAANANYANNVGGNMMSGSNAQAAGANSGMNALSGAAQGIATGYGNYNAPAPPGSGYSTMGQFASAPGSNLQSPGGYLGSGGGSPSYSLGSLD